MDMKRAKRFLLTMGLLYWGLAVMIYLAAGSQFHRLAVTTDALTAVASIGEVTEGQKITQRITAPAEQITSVDVMAITYGDEGAISISVTNMAGQEVAQRTVDHTEIGDGQYTTIWLEQLGQTQEGEPLELTLSVEGNPITVYYGNMVNAGRFDIAQNIAQEDLYAIDGYPGVGRLCVKLGGMKTLSFYKTYWLIAGGAFAALAAYAAYGYRMAKQGKNNGIVMICTLYCRYGFLLKQLVARDFKAKYKRSMLGMAWSFLNPLLMMAVQYVVFSTLFKTSTPNYPVYLLSGTVFFNFFSEAVSMGMTAITGNAALIKKVYIPKYIYPISKLFSSLINFSLSLIPLLLVMAVTGAYPAPAILLLVYDMLCMMGFVLGMMLLMSTAMTFFQDTQFLWGVISMVWMYFTPVFYTENIIPQNMLTLYHMNPMYHYITFARICLIDGVSPEPMAYLWCLLPAIVVLTLGICVFKKNQDRFVLHL